MGLKSVSCKFPFISAVLIQIFAVAFLLIPLKTIAISIIGEYPLWLKFLSKALVRILPALIILMFMVKTQYKKYLKWSFEIKYFTFIWVAVLIIILNFEYNDRVTRASLFVFISYLLYYISVGFFEEIVFRGAILCLLEDKWKDKKYGVLLSVIVSSFMFGSVHFINLLNKHARWQEIIGQVLYTTLLGIMFAAIMIRTKNIWLSVILHAAFDIAGSLNELIERNIVHDYANQISKIKISDIAINTLSFLPLALFGLFLIRRKALNK